MRSPTSKIMTLEQTTKWRRQLTASGKTLVVTNGCFDIVHRGHLEYLHAARQEGDTLLVALNSDGSVKKLKGEQRPIVCESDRAYILASLEFIDAVLIFNDLRVTTILEKIKPDIYVKGADYTESTLDPEELSVLKRIRCTIRFIKFLPGYSTTSFLNKLRNIN